MKNKNVQEFFKIYPKKPSSWLVDEVCKFLEHNNLKEYANEFSKFLLIFSIFLKK